MSIFDEAEKLVNGDRQKDYGEPRENLERISEIWSGVLGLSVTAEQVALCMAGLKLARLGFDPTNHDSLVDACGYLRLMEMIKPTDRDDKPINLKGGFAAIDFSDSTSGGCPDCVNSEFADGPVCSGRCH